MSFHFNCCSSSLLDLVKIKIFLYISLCKNSELLTSTWLWLDRTIQQSRTKNETKMLLTSNFYSVLYYNCKIWLSQGLNVRNKQQILAASCTFNYTTKRREHCQCTLVNTDWQSSFSKFIMTTMRMRTGKIWTFNKILMLEMTTSISMIFLN